MPVAPASTLARQVAIFTFTSATLTADHELPPPRKADSDGS